LGVIPADEYLPIMGWKLVIDGPTEYRLVKVNPAGAKQNTPLSTNLSAADIVTHCYDIGLAKRPTRTRTNAAAVAGAAMSFAAQPNLPKSPIVVQDPQLTGAVTAEDGNFDTVSNPHKAQWRNANLAKTMGGTTVNDDTSAAAQTATENATEDVINEIDASYAENLSIETATADVQQALEDYPDEYPYNLHFHPAVDRPIVAFDPTVVQDDFDPFDLNDFVNFNV
jgi:hypothetical protein